MRDPRLTVAKGLAAAFLAGDWERASMTRRGQRAVGQRRVWVRDLALAARSVYPDPPSDRQRELATFLVSAAALGRAFDASEGRREPAPRVRRWYVAPTAMGARRWPVATLDTVHDLRALLGLSAPDLYWYADPKGLERSAADGRLRHYRYRWSPKRSGGARLIEEPKPVLKHIQRVILREILGYVPPHPAAHGFCAGRSAVTFAAVHAGRQVLLHLNLRDFFASIPAGRVFGIFRQCGYPEPVAHLLTGLVTNAVPRAVWAGAPRAADPASLDASRRLGRHLAHPHLPQGAPTSAALANLAAFALDRRLSGLAAAAGLTYARYADDLALSSPSHLSAHQVAWLIGSVTGIAVDEGFRVNERKTSVRRAGQRQRLAGVIVNQRPNVDRREYERLKAILHNAGRSGAAAQNRDGHAHFRDHVRGRVAWVNHLNPGRGERLLAAFARVDWSDVGE